MLNEKFILDDFCITGNTVADFDNTIAEIATRTSFVACNSEELAVLSLFEHPHAKPNTLYFRVLKPMECPSITGTLSNKGVAVECNKILKYGNFQPLIDEILNETGVIFHDSARSLYVSKKVLTTKLQPFGIGGDFLGEKSFERDLMIAKSFSKKLDRTLVIREFNGVHKIFSILGPKYIPLPQKILTDIYRQLPTSSLGKAECHSWEITHFHSGIKIEFPEKAEELQVLYGLPKKFIPGIILETSDTGDCSIRIRSTWRYGASTTLHSAVEKKHSGTISVPKVLEEVDDKIFAEYTKLPEALCDLMSQDVTDPAWDLSVRHDRIQNRSKIESVVKNAFKKLKIVEAIGKKAEATLYKQLVAEFDPSIAYTAYDIATAIMTLPERVEGAHQLTMDKLSAAVGRAPYIKYEGKTSAASSIVLVA